MNRYVVAFSGLICAAAPASAGFLAGRNNGDIWEVDPSGTSRLLYTSTSDWPINSMARSPGGVYYGSHFTKESSWASLVRINPATGEPTFVRLLTGLKDVRALACSSSGVLYAIEDGGPWIQSTQPDRLYTVDAETGAIGLVGSTGRLGVQGMTFSPSGVLYAWDIVGGLMTMNPTTGAVIDINGVDDGTSQIQTLAFAPDGTLYGAGSSLFTIDMQTGSRSLVSGGLSDLRGMEWRVVPEPSGLVVLAGLGAAALRRRQPR